MIAAHYDNVWVDASAYTIASLVGVARIHLNAHWASDVVAGGRQNVGSGKENVMPSFGTNLNVMCYIDDLYIYLRARAQGDMPRGRPPKRNGKGKSSRRRRKAIRTR